MGKKTKKVNPRDSPEPGIVWRNVTRMQADELLRDTPTGTYLVRPSAHDEDSVALSFMLPSREVSHILIFHTEHGWVCENVEHPRRFLWELLNRLPVFLNLMDSERLVGGVGDTVHYKSLRTFLLERHDCLGIVFYRRSFSGLTRGRRLLHLFVAIVLLLGANLFAFSSLDGNCYKMDFCQQSCIESLGADACQPRNISVTVTDILDTRVTEYRPLYLFPFGGLSDPAQRANWQYCASVTNPIWDYSPVCLSLCQPVAEKFLLSDNKYDWVIGDDVDDVAPCTADGQTRQVLACESSESRAYPQLVGVTNASPDPVDTCASFSQRAESPSAVVFLMKAGGVAAFLLVTYAVMKRVLLLSQPVSSRHNQVRRDRTRLVKLSTSCLACFAVSGLLLFASALIAFGSYLIGQVVPLWMLFLSGIAVSVSLKFLVFQPLQITALWLLMRSGLWRLVSDSSAKELARQATLDELDLSQVEMPKPAPPRPPSFGRGSMPAASASALHDSGRSAGASRRRQASRDDRDDLAKVSTFTEHDGPPFNCPFIGCGKSYETLELLERHRQIRGHDSRGVPPLALASPRGRVSRQASARGLSPRKSGRSGGGHQGPARALSGRRRRLESPRGGLPVGRRRQDSAGGDDVDQYASPYRSISDVDMQDVPLALANLPSVRRDLSRLQDKMDEDADVADVVVSRGCCVSSILLAVAVLIGSATILILESAGCTTPSAIQRAGRLAGTVSTVVSSLAIVIFIVQCCRRHRLANCTVVLTTIGCSIIFFVQITILLLAYAMVYSSCSF